MPGQVMTFVGSSKPPTRPPSDQDAQLPDMKNLPLARSKGDFLLMKAISCD